MVPVNRPGWKDTALVLPVLFSVAGGILGSWPLMAAAFLLVPAVILLAPVCRGFENMWSFLLVFAVMPAPGIRAALQLRSGVDYWRSDAVLWVTSCVILYFGILGAAEILTGSLVRRLRRRQKGFLKGVEPDIVNFL